MITILHDKYLKEKHHRQIFRLLVIYRWLSLIPVLVTFDLNSSQLTDWSIGLATVILVNIAITAFSAQLNAVLVKRHWLFIGDVVLCGLVFYLVGGWESPYYLYAISPLLAAAFFLGLRGAIPMAGIMSVVYMATGVLGQAHGLILAEAAARVVGFFLIAGTVGYASVLLKDLQATHTSLRQAYSNLEAIHNLTSCLQIASDIREVQERVLDSIIDNLGFCSALIGLVDQDNLVITDWVGKLKNTEQSFELEALQSVAIPLKASAGHIAECLLQGEPRFAVQNIAVPNRTLHQILNSSTFHIFPMILRDHPIGVLVIGSTETESPELIESLKPIANQAAISVGTTLLCIDRAKRLAIQDERVRIACEMHDTLSQSLFGLSFALDACIKLLPDNPTRVKGELALIAQLAENTRRQVRQSIMDIWPSEITADTFAHDLHHYAHDFCNCDELDLTIQVRGPFQQLLSRTRRDLYRIAQEGLTNIIRHSGATEALVCLTVLQGEVGMIIRDNGRGFDVSNALRQIRQPEHFGLSGIQKRVESLNGTVEFLSQSDVGTAIVIMLPIDKVQAGDYSVP